MKASWMHIGIYPQPIKGAHILQCSKALQLLTSYGEKLIIL